MYNNAAMHCDVDDFNSLMYGLPDEETRTYLRDKVSEVVSYISNTSSDAMRSFVQQSQESFLRFNSDEALRKARAAIRKVQHVFQPNVIQSLTTISGMQQAKLVMQRWIMAQPTVRRLYHEQRCDGYNESYVDNHPDDIGADHYDCRRVMDGVVQELPDGSTKTTHYYDVLIEGDRRLATDERDDILSTWEMAEFMMKKAGEDITSPSASKL